MEQILSVAVLYHRLGQFLELLLIDPSALVGNLFQTGNFQSLSLLDDLDKRAGFSQGVVCTGIQPCESALQCLYRQAEETDCDLLSQMLLFICDSTNIKIAVRCARTKKDLSFTRLAVGPCDKLDRDALCLAAVQGEAALLEYLHATPYRDGAAALKKSTTAFEKWCDDSLVALCREAKYTFFGFEPIAAYYFAKTTEIKAVRIVLCAKQSGVATDIIRERVRALYV